MSKIIHLQDCSYLVGCKINMMETTFKLLSLCDRSEVELFPDQEFDIEGFK